jgi:hypothetical protein
MKIPFKFLIKYIFIDGCTSNNIYDFHDSTPRGWYTHSRSGEVNSFTSDDGIVTGINPQGHTCLL